MRGDDRAVRASSARRFAAESDCPGAGRSATTRSSYATVVPSSASTLSAQAMSATRSRSSRSCTASASRLVIASVPLMSARPSLGSTSIGVRPWSRSAAAPSTRSPSVARDPALAEQHGRDRRERCEVARRTERAVLGHPGHDRPRRAARAAPRPVPARTPESPAASVRARSRIIPRTTSSSRRGPEPAAWLSTTERCRSARSGGIDRTIGERAEPGGHAVDDRALAIEPVDHRARRRHPARGPRGSRRTASRPRAARTTASMDNAPPSTVIIRRAAYSTREPCSSTEAGGRPGTANPRCAHVRYAYVDLAPERAAACRRRCRPRRWPPTPAARAPIRRWPIAALAGRVAGHRRAPAWRSWRSAPPTGTAVGGVDRLDARPPRATSPRRSRSTRSIAARTGPLFVLDPRRGRRCQQRRGADR